MKFRFKDSEIFSLSSDIFKEEAFIPRLVTDHPATKPKINNMAIIFNNNNIFV